MSNDNPLYRQAALERLSSPEQLDQLVRVTRPAGWLALLALGLVLLAAIVWGILGSLPIQATGQGILLSADGLHEVVSPAAGQVAEVVVDAGEVIQAGQVVARIAARITEAGRPISIPVSSPFAGRVVERLVDVGTPVDAGAPLLSLEGVNPEGQVDLVAVIYMPPAEGKRIRPGMEVQVSPSTVRREEYGFMLGRVASVGRFPATPQGMLRALGNPELVKALSVVGAPIEIRVALTTDAGSASGYAWSSQAGPPIQVDSGTLCNAWVTLDQRRPMSLVFPDVK